MQVTFGGYCLDLGTRQLLHSKIEVRLSPKAFDLLHVLVENRTRAVSKAELHDRLWPGTFVTDANLTVLVAEAAGNGARREQQREHRSINTCLAHHWPPARPPSTAAVIFLVIACHRRSRCGAASWSVD